MSDLYNHALGNIGLKRITGNSYIFCLEMFGVFFLNALSDLRVSVRIRVRVDAFL